MKVFAYIRKSTDDDRLQQNSLEYQKQEIESRFKEEYGDIEYIISSESATSKGREGFKRIIDKIIKSMKQGEEGVFIAHDVDRILRNHWDLAVIYDLVKTGMKIRTIREDFLDESAMFSFSMKAIFAIEYVASMKRKMKSAYLKMAKEGKYSFGNIRGYQTGKEKNVREPHPIKSKGIQKIFTEYLKFPGSTSDFLHTANKILLQYGMTKMVKKTLFYILRNEYYIGMVNYQGETYKGLHEPIITKSVFNAVQEKLDGKKHKKVHIHNHFYKGMIKCKCERMLTAEKQKNNVYNRCHNKDCDFKSFKDSEINEAVGEYLRNIEFTPEGAERILDILRKEKKDFFKKKKSENVIFQEKLSKLEEKQEGILEMRINKEISKDYFKTKNKEIQHDIESLKTSFIGIKSDEFSSFCDTFEKIFELIESGFLTWETENHEKRAMILAIIGSNFYIDDKNQLRTELPKVFKFKNIKIDEMVGLMFQSSNSVYRFNGVKDRFFPHYIYKGERIL